MLESPFACLFEKYSLYLSQKGFELVATFKFSKYYFLYLLSLTTKLRCFLYLDKSAGNWDLLALFFSRERFMMAALNDLFKWGFWLPRKTFDFLGACWFSTFTKLFSKEVKITLLWRTLREICKYAWVNGIPHKSVMQSYADTVINWEISSA